MLKSENFPTSAADMYRKISRELAVTDVASQGKAMVRKAAREAYLIKAESDIAS